MERTKSRIDEIKKNGYDLNFDTPFAFALEIFKKIVVHAGVVMLVFIMITIGICLAALFYFIGIDKFSNPAEPFDPTQLSALHLFAFATCSILYTVLTGVVTAGIIKMAHCAHIGKDFSFATAFDYFNSKYLTDITSVFFVVSVINFCQSFLLTYFGLVYIGYFVSFIIGIFTFLMVPLIIFGNLKAFDAIIGSSIIVSKNFFMILLLIIVAYILAFAGMIACCVGMFFTIPFISAMQYSIYVNSIGIDMDEQTPQITDREF